MSTSTPVEDDRTRDLEVVHGETRDRVVARQLVDAVAAAGTTGTIYLGYPVLASADNPVRVDALLISPEQGLVAFLFGDEVPEDEDDWTSYVEDQDRLYSVLEGSLRRHESLRSGRRLALDVRTITVFPRRVDDPPEATDGYYTGIDEVPELLASLEGISADVERAAQAALQRVTTIKPAKKRAGVAQDGSRGAILKEIEKGIANLDRWQKRAAIESPEGPQRVRGLAGSGKTVVLALKAAYLHAQHPDWRIAVTFQTRALYRQIEDLVVRFSFEHSNDRPDFERLQILHAWGSSGRAGIYTSIARSMGVPPRDFNYARARYGMEEAFRGVCRELLSIASDSNDPPIFDAVLIDEAQDLPSEFFQLIYRFTKDPKRIVWAYDEQQKLNEDAMPSTADLFGRTSTGEALVSLQMREGEARRDIMLPVCYRNTPWSLATAHALGFGIYRDEGLVQHFDDPTIWTEIGYDVIHGNLAMGEPVTLKRSRSSYPEYFPELLDEDDAVQLKTFGDEAAQDAWVASQIIKNLTDEELEHDDILVVLPDAYTAKRRASRFGEILSRHDVTSHLAGVGSSVDEVFVPDSVAIAHIHRAKGNEAPMVYVLDAQYAAGKINSVPRRNTLFTAITRSRAWVRICGWGERMETVADEVSAIREEEFQLRFTIPTEDELARLRRINRDRSQAEVASLKKATRGARDLVDAFERGEIDFDDLPAALRTRLANYFAQSEDDAEFD